MSRIRARVKSRRPGLTPIARWDVVPYQRIGATFKIGIVAFSKYGIEKVEFSVTDGNSGTQTATVRSMTLNSRTGVVEFWTEITASAYDDGEITLSATVFGLDGGQRVMDDITLISDNGSTVPQVKAWVVTSGGNDSYVLSGNETTDEANPYASIGKAALGIRNRMNTLGKGQIVDGGIIYLKVGTHDWENGGNSADMNSTTEWLTITAASGGTPSDTKINAQNEAINIKRLCMKDIGRTNDVCPGPATGELWLDGVTLVGPNTNETWSVPFPLDDWFDARYITDSSFTTYYRPTTYHTKLIRNSSFSNIGGTVLLQPEMVVDVAVDDVDPGVTNAHANVIAWSEIGGRSFNNFIVYGLKATDCHYSGIIMHRTGQDESLYDNANIAFVDIDIELKDPIRYAPGPAGGFYLHHRGKREHELWWHVTFRYTDLGAHENIESNFMNSGYDEGSGISVISNCSFVGNNFDKWGCQDDTKLTFTNLEVDENHFATLASNQITDADSNKTSGSADMDSSGVPTAAGNLVDRLHKILTSIDTDGTSRDTTPDAGAYEYVA